LTAETASRSHQAEALQSRQADPAAEDLGRPRAGQFTKISDLFSGIRQYRTLGLVWFDNVQNDGLYHQDWRIETTRRRTPRSGSASPSSTWPGPDGVCRDRLAAARAGATGTRACALMSS
jgi:hypothetical protein